MFKNRLNFVKKYIRNVRNIQFSFVCKESETELSGRFESDTLENEFYKIKNHILQIERAHRCLVIQPYVKWGRKKLTITPDEQLSEAVALIRTLHPWCVEGTLLTPMETLDRKKLFGSGTMEKIKNIIRTNGHITAVFINSGTLSNGTQIILQEEFNLPVFDRYKIIMYILKLHATSKHAKLQVNLAEIEYMKRRCARDLQLRIFNSDALRLVFQKKVEEIKSKISDLRLQRAMLRNKRQKKNYPIVAIVGYTNAGKTAVIKALTHDETLQPKDQLFATLDVTVHKGILPSGLEVLYIDTVGFISDVPTNLIECFVATLEDVLLADVIVHVEDLSSTHFHYKREHVIKTLKNLSKQAVDSIDDILNKVISVGNKCDLLEETNNQSPDGVLYISAEKGIGLEQLRNQIEAAVLKSTGRKKITMRIGNGGDQLRWLYRNCTVLQQIPDEKDLQYTYVKVILLEETLEKFRSHFYK